MTLPKGGPPTYLGKGYKVLYKCVLIKPLGLAEYMREERGIK